MKRTFKKSLMPNETVVYNAKFTWALFLPSALTLLVSIINTAQDHDAAYIAMGSVFAIIFALPGLKCVLFNSLIITSVRIYGKTGVIKTQELTSPLKQIQNVKVDRSVPGRLFGYGSVSITTASGAYVFKFISSPNRFRQALMSQIEAAEYGKMDAHAEKIADAIYRKNNP